MTYQVKTTNCNCYWTDEWHPEENVYMPDFMQCESCKCIEADQLFVNQIQGDNNE